LKVSASAGAAYLKWEVHGGDPTNMIVERRIGDRGNWENISVLPATATEFSDARAKTGEEVSYRVRARNDAGESAYSNIARLKL
jgi:hypothetical protein